MAKDVTEDSPKPSPCGCLHPYCTFDHPKTPVPANPGCVHTRCVLEHPHQGKAVIVKGDE